MTHTAHNMNENLVQEQNKHSVWIKTTSILCPQLKQSMTDLIQNNIDGSNIS